MKSFKEYAKQNGTPKDGQDGKNTPSQTDDNTQTAANAEELTKKIARAYNGKSNAAMLRNILLEAEKSKRAGTLSNAEIESFYQSFAPMLDSVQKRKLRAIVEELKQI
jgi:hypothetical protein